MAFFDAGNGGKSYTWIRDSKMQTDVRERVEALWTRYKPLCRDPAFCKDARTHFNARVFQMYGNPSTIGV